ncbi:hypothetical protein ACYSNU_09165 [Enterococcus sp. LJL120]
MDKYTGLLTKIKLIKEEPLLVRFTLVSEHERVNCIVANPRIAIKILMLPNDKYKASVIGHRNKYDQLVIRWLAVDNGDNFARELGL